MVKAYYFYDVAEEKQAEYLKFVAEVLKPFFQSRGARSYDVHQNVNLEKSTNFMAEMIFDDVETMQKTKGLHGNDPEYDAMVQRFFSFVTEPGVKPMGNYVQKI